MSVKFLPEFRNHLFTYGLQSKQRLLNFRKIMRRAPEVLGQFHTQVNSYHRMSVAFREDWPKIHCLMPTAPRPAEIIWYYGFYLNPYSVEDTVDHMLSWGEFEASKLSGFQKVMYVPLTNVASNDLRFQRWLSETIAKTYFDEQGCLLMRLPSPGADLSSRLHEGAAAIHRAGLRLPRVRASNIFFVADDISEQSLQALGARLWFVLHHSYDYWRYTQSMYRGAGHVLFHHELGNVQSVENARQLFNSACGRVPEFDMAADSVEIEPLGDLL